MDKAIATTKRDSNKKRVVEMYVVAKVACPKKKKIAI
jgi:hypothetical protein